MVGRSLHVVEEADEVPFLTERAQEKIGVEPGRSRVVLFRKCGGDTGGFAGHHPDGLESNRPHATCVALRQTGTRRLSTA